MAAFSTAFHRTMQSEGGYVLHEVAGDRGGMTFAGIARKFNASWSGWQLVDAGDRDSAALKKSVAGFYLNNYFNACGLKNIKSQVVANVVYDFAVNAGVRTAVHLVQQCVGVSADGIVGPRTIAALNQVKPSEFVAHYSLAKVARYAAIVNRDRSQNKFLLGWLNRTLRDLESL
jgi:lysozyme family protein